MLYLPVKALPVHDSWRWTLSCMVLQHCQVQCAEHLQPAHRAPYHGSAPLQVFTTCGSEKKREFLKKTFPFLDDDHIGDSHSTSFEALISKQVIARL